MTNPNESEVLVSMNISKYLAFVKTVEYGSFTKAAEMLNYSQPGISRMIHDLESEWKMTLLERCSRNGVLLTSDGARMLPFARQICDDYAKLCMEIDDVHGMQSGMIRIGTFSSTATHWLPNIIKAFQKDYPGIDYEFLLGDYAEIETWIEQGRVDCGFVRLPTKAELDTIPLANDRLLAILPERHPLTKQESVPLKALCREPFLLLEHGKRADVSELFERHKLTPRVHFTTWDDYAIMSMVESGLGVSILPELILRRTPYRIVAKPLDVSASRTIGLAMRSRKNASVAVKKFINYLSYRNPSD